MDEYSFQNYQHFPQSENFSNFFLNDSEIQQKIHSQNQKFENSSLKNQQDDNFATNYTCSIPPSSDLKTENGPPTSTLITPPQKPFRKIRKIQTSSRIQVLNQFTFSGSKNDTVELNTNYKTLFKNFIKQNFSELSSQNSDFLISFEKSVSSFKAFSELYKSNFQIKQLCSKLIRSNNIIRKVMKSRAKFWMRLQMIKYIEALNKNLDSDKLVRWKSIRKHIN